MTFPPGGTPRHPRHVRWRFTLLGMLVLGGAAVHAFAFEDTTPPLRVAIIGDSTVATYPAESQIRGWGEFISPRLRRRVEVRNSAVPGASSSSFIGEGHWQRALAGQPAIVLIQFGHNDFTKKTGPDRFRQNLEAIINSAKLAGALPILVTPVQLRDFEGTTFVPSLQLYAAVMRDIATRTGIALVDLHALSAQLFARLGPVRAEQLGGPVKDRTHFNRLGAQALAEIVLRELAQQRTPLTREIILTAPPPPRSGPTPIPAKVLSKPRKRP